MPYYSIPQGTKYEEIAYAYNKPVIIGLLRDSLGFKGIINSDTGPIEMMPWGAENLSIKERYKNHGGWRKPLLGLCRSNATAGNSKVWHGRDQAGGQFCIPFADGKI